MATLTGSATYTAVKNGLTRSLKITVIPVNPGANIVYETSVSGGNYVSGNPIIDQLVQLVDAQALGGATSGSITVSVT